MKIKNIVKNLTPSKLKIAIISSYPPRKCGIASYTKDLVNSIQANSSFRLDIMAVTEQTSKYLLYPRIVKKKFNKESKADYHLLAQFINKGDYNVVHLQHEFGLYGGKDGEYLLDLLAEIKVPIIITFHTVLSKEDKHKENIVKELCQRAERVIVMAEEAKKILNQKYLINAAKIQVIRHGVPNILLSNHNPDNFKKQLLPRDQTKYSTLGTFGFIGPNKGLEYLITAMPEIISKNKNVLLLISGSTHPIEKNRQGTRYVESLRQLISTYRLENNVILREKFLSTKDIINFLFATDIYITPYLDPEQITSGTLTYAIGAGKPLISTPYAYAAEVVGYNEGLLVPFRDSHSVASGVLYLLNNPAVSEMMASNNRLKSEQFSWNHVGSTHVALIQNILDENKKVKLDIITNIKDKCFDEIEKNINNIEQ